MVAFNKLKKRSTNASALANKANTLKGGGFKKDERIWTPKRDTDGNFEGVVRFLRLGPEDEDLRIVLAEEKGDDVADTEITPFVLMYKHAFKGPGGWYIENSRTTLGQDEPDPLAELNKEEWDDNDDAAKKRVSNRSRRKKYYSNILVIDDKTVPENNGKVMIFEYGQKIFDKIKGVLEPQFKTETMFNPFEYEDGANFVLKVFTEIKGKNKFPNYDKCYFAEQTSLFDGDDTQLEKVYDQCYSLQAIVDEDKFKSYDKLKQRLDKVMGNTVKHNSVGDYDTPPKVTSQQEPLVQQQTAADNISDNNDSSNNIPDKPVESEATDSDMDFFNNL